MSISAPPAKVPIRSPLEVVRHLQQRVSSWSDLPGVAAAAAEVLREALLHPSVTVYGIDPASQSLVMLGCAPGQQNGPAVGSWLSPRRGTLGTAARSGLLQRVANAYVEPDFVRSLPGEIRSELAVPVLGQSGPGGVIHLEYAAPYQPGPVDEELTEAVALQLAPVLELAAASPRAGEAASCIGGEGAPLGSLIQLLGQNPDVASVQQRLVAVAREALAAESAVLALRHHARQMLEVVAAAGPLPIPEGELLPVQDTGAGDALRLAQPQACETARRPVLGPRDAELGIGSALVVPVLAAGNTLGVLAVLDRAERTHAPAAVATLQSLAGLAGALDSIRSIAMLRQRLSDSSMIAEVGRAMTGTLGLDEVFALVVRAAEMLAGARGVALGLISEERDAMLVASTGGVLRSWEGQRLPVQSTLLGWATLNAEITITPSASDDPRGFPHEVRQGPAVVVPLESRGKTRGALMITRAEGAPLPSAEDVDALRKLAAYAAIAIDNAQLYREQTELSDALRAQAQELERAYADLRESQQRLLVSEKMAALGRLTAGIAHEINSPLGGIMNCLQLARSYATEYRESVRDPEVSPEDHESIANDLLEALAMAETGTRKVGQFVRTIKGQTRNDGEQTRIPFDPAQEIEGTVVLLQHELRNHNVNLHIHAERGLLYHGDPGKFSVVVQNLITNAIDAYLGRPGDVQIRLGREGDRLVLQVSDEGCGIPESIRDRIFDYLFTTKDVGQGTGLGLSVVHSIVTTHLRGEIRVQSEVGVGSTFEISFPISAEDN